MHRAEPSEWFRRHPRAGRCLVSAALAAAALALDFTVSNIHRSVSDFELYVRSEPIGHRHKPDFSAYYGMRFWNPFKTRIHFNQLGFRDDRPFDATTTGGRKVIFTAGDSTTAGFEVPLEDSYPAVLQAALGDRYAVFNAGVRAYDTQQVIIQYLTQLRPLKPYAVIYMITPNDFTHNVATDFGNEYVRYFGKGTLVESNAVQYVPPQRDRLGAGDWLHWQFKKNFNFTSYLCKRLQMVFHRRGSGRADEEGSSAGFFSAYCTPETMRRGKALLRFFESVTSADGCRLYVSFYPGFAEHPETARSLPEFKAYEEIKAFINTELTNVTFLPLPDRFLAEYAADSRKPPMTFSTDMHANRYGNREIGRVTADLLREK
jgi:hypothetical protein